MRRAQRTADEPLGQNDRDVPRQPDTSRGCSCPETCRANRERLGAFPVADHLDQAAAGHDLDLAGGESVAHDVALAPGLVDDLDVLAAPELFGGLVDRED